MLRLAVLTAASVSGEKDARTWPVLLTTPMSDRQIIYGKAIASLRRNAPFLLMHVILFSVFLLSVSSWAPTMMAAMLLSLVQFGGSVVIVVGAGLYFGVRLRTTAAAVASTVGLCLLCSSAYNPLRGLLFISIYRLAGSAGLPILRTVAVVMICVHVGVSWLFVKASGSARKGQRFLIGLVAQWNSLRFNLPGER